MADLMQRVDAGQTASTAPVAADRTASATTASHRRLQGVGYDAGRAMLSRGGLSSPPGASAGAAAGAEAATAGAEAATAGAAVTSTATVAPTTTTTATVAPTASATVAPAAASALPAAPALLTIAQLEALGDVDLLTYVQTRPSSHLDSLRSTARFLARVEQMSLENMASVTLAIILRTPDQVVDKAGATAEAMRVLGSQLRDKVIMANLLRNNVRVVICPRNQLITDLPEFAAQRDTFTFDGRPWDTVRGLGGRNTAITEENLLGLDQVDGGNTTSRLGWNSKASMDAARATDATAMPQAGGANVVVNNPGVYCDGYSTTNHEFFHTIHQYGLTAADTTLIQTQYDAKRGTGNDTEWADGPRKMPDNSPSENYASSTVYEYFAQTGCAFQGTNVGADCYTGRARNNGRGWVTTNEAGLAPLLTRICASQDLTGANPRDARRAADAARANNQPPPTATPAPGAPTTATTTTATTTTAGAAQATATPGAATPDAAATNGTTVAPGVVGALVAR
jgi:hypothetical protein